MIGGRQGAGLAEAMGNRRRITLFSRRGRPLGDTGVKGLGLPAGKGMSANRSPREGFRPLMEESPLTTMLGDRPMPELREAGPSSRVVVVIELVCFVVIAFVAGSALLFYGGSSSTPTAQPSKGGKGPVALLQQLEPSAAPEPSVGKPAPPAESPAPQRRAGPPIIELPPSPPPPQVALAPDQADAPVPGGTVEREEPPATPLSAPAEPTPVEAAPPPPAAATAATTASAEEIAGLVARGGELLKTGDIIGARLSYERAAADGSAAAATGAGKTYDPLYLVSAGVRGIKGDPLRAVSWYRKGAAAGDAEAQQRLKALQFAFPQ